MGSDPCLSLSRFARCACNFGCWCATLTNSNANACSDCALLPVLKCQWWAMFEMNSVENVHVTVTEHSVESSVSKPLDLRLCDSQCYWHCCTKQTDARAVTTCIRMQMYMHGASYMVSHSTKTKNKPAAVEPGGAHRMQSISGVYCALCIGPSPCMHCCYTSAARNHNPPSDGRQAQATLRPNKMQHGHRAPQHTSLGRVSLHVLLLGCST
jgi:hypothetical protein